MNLYKVGVILEADSVDEAWARIQKIPISFRPSTDWAGFQQFSIEEVGTGRKFGLALNGYTEESK